MSNRPNKLNRRDFLKRTAAAGAASAAALPALRALANAAPAPVAAPGVGMAIGSDPVASSPVVKWATSELIAALRKKNIPIDDSNSFSISISGPFANSGLKSAPPESLSLSPIVADSPGTLVMGSDPRGLSYAILELADRITHAPDAPAALAALKIPVPNLEQPANKIRGIFRMFVSDVEDTAWFHDRDFWPKYLTTLATNRFNRFNLSLGLGYDFSSNLRDTYFFFAYPFLVNVPGYNVRAVGNGRTPSITPDDQAKNLATLKFISDEAAARGLDFQLGIWTHSYKWTNSPNATYIIEGLDANTQAPYSRDALHMILDHCPGISGVTLRTHGESGVPEGSYGIWKEIMSGITGLKTADGKPRTIELDMHGKSMTQEMIDTALTFTNMPVTISPKFWAEHMGLPYMQASIREAEMPKGKDATGLMALSSGTRSFLRYSFGDLIQKDRKFKINTRVWHGTQRLHLWGDPKFAAEMGRTFSFAGTDGVDYFEPLSFKGRMGSGVAPAVEGAQRSGYADKQLLAEGGDWQKYLYTYRLLGRLAYNPDTDPEVWQRQLRSEYGPSADAVEKALANSSRILPLLTSAHDPSASNQQYWPEIATNQSIVDGRAAGPFGETPAPKTFGAVTSLDPQMFLSVNQTADALLAGKTMAAINVLEVAAMMEKWSTTARATIKDVMESLLDGVENRSNAKLRVGLDVLIATAMGQFFAFKTRAAVLWAICERTGNTKARDEAVALYQKARDAWDGMNSAAKSYALDLTFGFDPHQRGNWNDRLAAIDKDIAAMKTMGVPAGNGPVEAVAAAIDKVLKGTPQPRGTPFTHQPPKTFTPGQPLVLSVAMDDVPTIRLWYRHVNQGERWQSTPLDANKKCTIPADYTKSPFALQYYFESEIMGNHGMLPGFKENFTGQPYFLIMPA